MKEEKKLPEAGSLILYREVPEKHILQDILELSYLAEAGVQDEELLALCLQELTELAAHYGLQGNLWHAYLA